MHEFKHGELETRGRKVKNPRQAVAIALSEAGASKKQSPKQNRERLAKTKQKERRGETARDQKEGRRTTTRKASRSTARRTAATGKTTRKSTRSTGTKTTRAASRTTARRNTPLRTASGSDSTRAELYAEARRRDIPGRSRMNKAQLEKALKRKRA